MRIAALLFFPGVRLLRLFLLIGTKPCVPASGYRRRSPFAVGSWVVEPFLRRVQGTNSQPFRGVDYRSVEVRPRSLSVRWNHNLVPVRPYRQSWRKYNLSPLPRQHLFRLTKEHQRLASGPSAKSFHGVDFVEI
jgi:hypothetical protein